MTHRAAQETPDSPPVRLVRSVDLRTVAGARIQLVGVDMPSVVPVKNVLGVVELPGPMSAAPSFVSRSGRFEQDDHDEHDERDVVPAVEDGLTVTDRAWVARTAALIRENVLRDADSQATVIADAVVAKLTATGVIAPPPVTTAEPERILISSDEAAALLGITRRALAKRVERHQVPGVCRVGRRIQFNKAKLLSGLDRRTRA